ncbi:MAG TPA: glycosyltransferase [Niabella sp.]|uniref:glycosyltransferase n=1 Tax=Agriterribacter sp. TaxID=2821509 RepID=UPI002BF97539|nr:glycosyltransferase [Agriterribacter sp.]HRO85695.1 glycosyltransferase [Niabella sp.]HRP54758.1 glycosyltransferase [Agriterribacter sp.]
MEFVVVSDNYPSRRKPNKGVFVYNLVQELSNYHNITVIAPFKVRELFNSISKDGYGKERCKVYRPVYFSFSNKKFLGINTQIWSRFFISKAVNRSLKNLPGKPGIIYAHFISNALTALSYAKKHSIPLVIASGESSYPISSKAWEKDLQGLKDCTSHFICVSETNKKGLMALGFNENKMTVIPNAVDYSLFKPLNKEACKKKTGISPHKFVVGFVGNFIHRKGPNRIIEAIKQLNDKDIQLVCVGGREGLTANEFTKTIPPLPNYQLPEIYNAFDIFVLPTLTEGHCNAIEEAKACCIPVVSSLGTSVETQIDKTTGILINPLNIHEIAGAIQKLKSRPDVRMSMAETLKLKTGEQSLKNRAQKISSLLTKTLNENQ